MFLIGAQLAAAVATAVWAIALRGVCVDTQLSVFVVVGLAAAAALCVCVTPKWCRSRPVVSLAVILATYQALLCASFASGNYRSAQVIVNLNFIFILAYDTITGRVQDECCGQWLPARSFFWRACVLHTKVTASDIFQQNCRGVGGRKYFLRQRARHDDFANHDAGPDRDRTGLNSQPVATSCFNLQEG